MKESEFSKNFPSGVPPTPLAKLLAFQNRSKKFYSGHFELTDDGPRTALASFDNDQDAASQFILFGQEADGSSFGYWLYDKRTVENAPIVYLGSEGGGWTVLADSIEEFLSLLAIGADDAGSANEWGNIVEADEPAERLPAFRKWLKSEFGIVSAENSAKIVENAKKNHPDLQKWLSAWQKSHFGG